MNDRKAILKETVVDNFPELKKENLMNSQISRIQILSRINTNKTKTGHTEVKL